MPIRLFIIAAALALSGCANLSTLQTARTVPVGKSRWTLGGGYFQSPKLDLEASRVTSGTAENVRLPYFEAGYRGALSESYDWGIRLTLPGTLALDAKHQWLDGKEWAASIGFGLGYLYLPATIAPDSSYSLKSTEGASSLFDLMLPLVFSYDFDRTVSIYLSPKYFFRILSGGTTGTMSLYAGTLGLKIGRKTGVFIEGTYLRSPDQKDFEGYQLNMALFFGSAETPISSDGIKELRRKSMSSVVLSMDPKRAGWVFVKHPNVDFPWQLRARACVKNRRGDRACGQISASLVSGAWLSLDNPQFQVDKGDLVLAE